MKTLHDLFLGEFADLDDGANHSVFALESLGQTATTSVRLPRRPVRQAARCRARLGCAWSLCCLGVLFVPAALSMGCGAEGAGVVGVDSVADAPWEASMSIWFFSGRAELDATESLKIAALGARARAEPGLEFGIHRPIPVRVPDALPGSVPDRSPNPLGEQRVSAIRDAMVAAGIPAGHIHVGAYGGRVYDVDRRMVIFVRSPPPAADAALPRQDDDVSTE